MSKNKKVMFKINMRIKIEFAVTQHCDNSLYSARVVVTFAVTTMELFTDEWVDEWGDEWSNDDQTEGDCEMNESNLLLQENESDSIQNDLSINECSTSVDKIETDLDTKMETGSIDKVNADLDGKRATVCIDKVDADLDETGATACINKVEADLGKTVETASIDEVKVDRDKTEETASASVDIEADLGKTIEFENSLDQGVAVGYVHNISTVKTGNYFDFVLQTKSKTVRAVCFSPNKRKSFIDHSSGPVQVKKFQIDSKSNNEDLLMGADVSVLPVANLDFPKLDLPETTDLLKIKSSYIGQLVTVKAKVVHLGRVQFVKSGKLQMIDGTLVDSVSSMKIILWEEFANAVVVGDTYIFKNIRVKKDRMTSEVYVNTAKNGTIITPSDAFNTPLYTPLEQQKNYGNSTFVGKLIGVEKVASYFSCCKCSKKVDINHSMKIVECQSCHVKQNLNCCNKHWYVHILFKHNSDKITLTMFEQALVQLFDQLNTLSDFDSVSEHELVEKLLTIPASVEITFVKRTKIVSSISVQ